MYWATWVWTNYSPPWCYGEDEATVSFVSNAPGSGEDANYSFILPADGTYTQGDFYDTIWLGGAVYDKGSLDNQSYLEFQFYPAPPEYSGGGSGVQDCLPNGAFYPNYTAGSNEWFACAVVWQVTTSENAAFAGPLDLLGTTSIFILHSNDQVYVNESGVAQSTTQPWQISVTDGTTHASGVISLQNGSKILSPYYSTAAKGNDLIWGADTPGAISLAYEDGHSLNPAIPEGGYYNGCYPGDGVCDSYWPGRWAQSGQMQLSLPVMGSPGNQTYPYDIGFGSPTEGEDWINGTSAIGYNEAMCGGEPSWSTLKNCLYPWYTYRAENYSFDFGANNQTNDTHDYGSLYEFPAAVPPNAVAFHAAPWGVLDTTVSPAFAHVEFNRVGGMEAVPVLSNDTVYHQFMEGAYWLNVSYPGCVSSSTSLYLAAGAVYDTPIQLSCVGLFPVTYSETGLPAGTSWYVAYDGYTFSKTSSSISVYEPNGTQSYSVRSPVPGTPGVRYVATPSNGTIDVQAAPASQSIVYATQFEFLGVSSPVAVGVIEPNLTWEPPGTHLQVTALPGPSWVFVSWSGVGNGSYNGTANPAPVVMNGPVQEAAFFYFLYTVSFTETGLPSHTSWGVDLNGVFRSASGPTISFQMANGSYTYNISGPSGYNISTPTGSGTVHGSDVSVAILFTAIVLLGLTGTELELILLVVVAVGIALGVNVAYWYTHRKRPPAPPPPSAGPPPPWLGGPPQ